MVEMLSFGTAGRVAQPNGPIRRSAEPNMDRGHARLTAALLRMTPPDVAAPFFESDAWTSLKANQQAMITDADAEMEEKDRRRRQQARQERAERRSTRD
ncbi:hypothetical protein ACWDRB_49575 [Nonomuraea sp. NPDC003707]